nr:6852_t:CDS:2 [Entrophospora candida]
MPKNAQNKGPCAIIDCQSIIDTDRFRTITDAALEKLQEHPDYTNFNYLKLNDQLCHPHYMKYVESAKRRRLNLKDSNKDSIEKKKANDNFFVEDVKINIKITENGVLLSEEDFKLLVQKIDDMEFTIEKNQNEIEHLLESSDVYLTVQNNLRKSR